MGSDSEHVSAKEEVHVKKAGKKGTKSQLGSRFFKPKSNFIYRPVSKPNSTQVLEDSDDEVDEVLEMEGGGFLNDMEDYYDGYDDQVLLPDKLQAICDQFDIRLNTRRR
ncbi:hypothetical protein CTI12_AA541410 [Artemisia annua]|uniref:Uncharacterized protein n=1 Tax=Artemisia annua TaxID=35608 RepID=A0A2U1L1C3_ARTAN|nr:hypothetical protein CTI12_AA541410 [Artemisia annua]